MRLGATISALLCVHALAALTFLMGDFGVVNSGSAAVICNFHLLNYGDEVVARLCRHRPNTMSRLVRSRVRGSMRLTACVYQTSPAGAAREMI